MPLGAVCRGGNQLKTISGYWRPSNTSDEIQPCREPSACLGAIPPSILQQHRGPEFYGEEVEHNESCADGYYSKLCYACLPGFARRGKPYVRHVHQVQSLTSS